TCAEEFQISDYDLEILLVNPEDPPSMTMPALMVLLESAGYESIRLQDRYTDTPCDINPEYVCFYDPKTTLTCQITLDHPIGVRVRDLLNAYQDDSACEFATSA
ncbi:hypothetical protein BGX23_005568, partial [Mortierella sp. AD031]